MWKFVTDRTSRRIYIYGTTAKRKMFSIDYFVEILYNLYTIITPQSAAMKRSKLC